MAVSTEQPILPSHPNGDFYVSDGYQNSRILRFSNDGKRIGAWGSAGTGPGELNLPHGIAVGADGTVYVADWENLRIQRFDAEGRHLGTWDLNGKVFSLKWTVSGELWGGVAPHDVPAGSEGWLMQLDPANGNVLGHLDAFGHSIEVTPNGEVLTGQQPGFAIVFRPR